MKNKLSLGITFLLVLLLVGCSGSTGPIAVESIPEGAEVYIDRRFVGTTPLNVSEVPEGRREVRLKKEGYYDTFIDVRISSNQHPIVSEELVPTLSTFKKELLTFSKPHFPVVARFANAFRLVSLEAVDIWHPYTQKGMGVAALALREAEMKNSTTPTTDEKHYQDRLWLLGTSNIWSTRMLSKDIALINFNNSGVNGFLAVYHEGRWWLMRDLNKDEDYATVSITEINKNTELWLREVTGYDIVEEFLENLLESIVGDMED